MARSIFYDQNTHSLAVAGIPIQDFHEGDDVIAWEPQGDNVTTTRGLDSNAISFGSPRPGILTVRLKPTSPSIILLQELSTIAHSGFPRLVPALLTTGVEDVLDLINCAVSDTGYQTGGGTMQARTFTITAENYNLRETF